MPWTAPNPPYKTAAYFQCNLPPNKNVKEWEDT